MKQHGKKKERSTWAANAYQEGGHVGFVRTLVYEVRTAAQSVAGATARAGADASASVGAGAEAAAAAGDGAPCRAGAGVGACAGVTARSSGRSA